MFIAAALGAFRLADGWRRRQPRDPARALGSAESAAAAPAAYAIGSLAAFWVFERTLALWT